MFVDLDWPLNASSLLSASAELLFCYWYKDLDSDLDSESCSFCGLGLWLGLGGCWTWYKSLSHIPTAAFKGRQTLSLIVMNRFLPYCIKHYAVRLLYHASPVIYPAPPGGYNPQFSCDTPTIWSSKGVIRGVFMGCVCVIVMEGVINNNKMLMYKIWPFYSQEYC